VALVILQVFLFFLVLDNCAAKPRVYLSSCRFWRRSCRSIQGKCCCIDAVCLLLDHTEIARHHIKHILDTTLPRPQFIPNNMYTDHTPSRPSTLNTPSPPLAPPHRPSTTAVLRTPRTLTLFKSIPSSSQFSTPAPHHLQALPRAKQRQSTSGYPNPSPSQAKATPASRTAATF